MIWPDLTLCLPSWRAKDPTNMASIDDPRLGIITKVIAVQLLACCFTLPQNINSLTLPIGQYNEHPVHENGRDIKLVSSLRRYTQRRYSPAHGHHARNNSVVSLEPDKERRLSREERLAEEAFCKRLLRRRERRDTRKGLIRMCGFRQPKENNRRKFFYLPHRRNRDRSRGVSTIGLANSIFPFPSSIPLDPDDGVRYINILRVNRGL